MGVQVGDGFGLGRIEVAGRDHARAAALQGQEHGHGLGLDVDAGPDREALEWLRPIELLGDRG